MTKTRLNVHYILETHADHLTSAQYLKENLSMAKTVIHENIKLVQQTFKSVFNYGTSLIIDYQPGGRNLEFKTTIGKQKESNIQLKASTTRDQFVKLRTERDGGLMAPRLLLASIQVNAQNGILPKAETNGVSYLKIPLHR